MKTRKRLRWLNLVLTLLMAADAAVLFRRLLSMNLLPDVYVTLIGLAVMAWFVIEVQILKGGTGGKREIVTALVTVGMILVMLGANSMMIRIHQAMEAIIVEEEAEEDTDDAASGDATVEEEEEIEPVTLTDEESIFVVYISGIDDTGDIEDTVSRSDVNILAVINTQTGSVQLINTPRDYYVYLPQKNAYDKLTHAGLYGIDCSMAALAYLYNIEINYYVRINFTGFETLIDDIGGIDIYVEEDFVSNDGISYTAGWNHMDGYLALNYARERKAFATGDVQRGENQMQVIEAIVDQMLSGGSFLLNFSTLLSDVTQMVQTNMTTTMIYDLVRYQLSTDTDWDFSAYTVSGTNARKSVYSISSSTVYVMVPDETMVEEAKALIQAALSGESLEDAAEESGDATNGSDAEADSLADDASSEETDSSDGLTDTAADAGGTEDEN